MPLDGAPGGTGEKCRFPWEELDVVLEEAHVAEDEHVPGASRDRLIRALVIDLNAPSRIPGHENQADPEQYFLNHGSPAPRALVDNVGFGLAARIVSRTARTSGLSQR